MLYLRINCLYLNKIHSFVGLSNGPIIEVVAQVTTDKHGNMPRCMCQHMEEHDVPCAHIATFYNSKGIIKYCWTLVKKKVGNEF